MPEPVDAKADLATTAVEPAATPKRAGVDLWETVGKLVIPVTIACYVLGFLVAMPHFAKAGVPIDAISPQRFLAAGVLFLVLTAAVALSGVNLRRALSTPKGPARRHAYLRMAQDLGAPVGILLWVLQAQLIALVFGLLFLAVGIVIAFLLVYDFGLPSRSEGASGLLRDILNIVYFGLMLIGSFATLVYPYVPVRFGGGMPDPIVMVDTKVGSAGHDAWASVACRAQPLPAPSCRTIYRVYENSSHLFVAVADVPGACTAAAPEWDSWRGVASRRGCYQSISRAEIPRLESSGQP